jgi:hypothetical protein
MLYVDNTGSYSSTATYVWYRNDTEVLRGEGLHTYITDAAGSYSVYVYSSDGCGSGSDTLTVTQGTGTGITTPQILSESVGTVICGTDAGIMLGLTTDYTGTGTTISYQWFKGTNPISGANSTHYYATEAGDYSLLVTVDNCSSQSSAITVTYNGSGATAKPDIKSQGDITELCSGTSSLMLYVDNTGSYSSTATYVWYRNDTEVLRGAGLHTYTTDEAGKYSVYVYSADGCGSGSDTLTVTQGTGTGITTPQIISESGGTVICGTDAGIMLRLTTSYTGTTISYQWFKGTNPISGATSTHYYATESGDYSLLVTVDNCSSQSNEISITYDANGNMPKADLRSENNSTILCSGSSILLYVNNSDDYSSQATYVWYESDVEITRGVNMYNYPVNASGTYSVLVFEPNGCLSVSIDTITISVVDSLVMDSISSSLGLHLIYNESTNLTAEGVQGGISPYIYTWYKKTEGETSWTEVYTGSANTLTTGGLTENICYKVAVSSSDPLLSCNVATDSICIEVSQVELQLEFLDTIYSICNSTSDSIRLKITNSKPGFATNIEIEFKNEGNLPSMNNIIIDSLPGDSDTTIVIYMPENTSLTAQTGLLKAEIISCDQTDANPLTIYGSWKNANWAGDATQADEDMLNLTLYPNMRLTSKWEDTICSGETFTYEPQSNLDLVTVSWIRNAVAGISENFASGQGEISEVLTNDLDMPVTVIYTLTLEKDDCPSPITFDLEVVVLPKLPLSLSHYPPNGSIITFGTPVTIVSQTTPNIYIRYRYSLGNSPVNPLIYEDDPDGGEYEYKIFEFDNGDFNTVRITAVNEYGCEVTGTEMFVANYDLPNLITPKSPDGTNLKLLEGYDIQVFNRWGSELYSGRDGWNGMFKGKYVASGTYFYILRYIQPNGKILTFKRSVFVKY